MASTKTVTSKGRQKIEIKPICDKSKKHVTFSKRKKGLFKKVEEFCSLTKYEACVITITGAGRVFSLGYPSIDAVIQRYLDSADKNSISAEDRCHNLSNKCWWDEPIEELGLVELDQLKVGLEEFRDLVASRLVDEEKKGSKKVSEADVMAFDSSDWAFEAQAFDYSPAPLDVDDLPPLVEDLDGERKGFVEVSKADDMAFDSIDWAVVPQGSGKSSVPLDAQELPPLLENLDEERKSFRKVSDADDMALDYIDWALVPQAFEHSSVPLDVDDLPPVLEDLDEESLVNFLHDN